MKIIILSMMIFIVIQNIFILGYIRGLKYAENIYKLNKEKKYDKTT